jgi:hypothetical protein
MEKDRLNRLVSIRVENYHPTQQTIDAGRVAGGFPAYRNLVALVSMLATYGGVNCRTLPYSTNIPLLVSIRTQLQRSTQPADQ